MAIAQAIPEPVYDAALRVITREPREDDAEQLRTWWSGQNERTVRDIALEVMRVVSEHGYYRPGL